MKLQNISNHFQEIYISIREGNNLKIEHIQDFHPYIYEPDTNGEYKGYDGVKLTKIHCKSPHEIKNIRTSQSYEADVIYVKRFLIDRVDRIEKSNTKYLLYDIEVAAEKEFPDPKFANYPVTFCTFYNNYTKEYITFDYRDYKTEFDMLEAMCVYIKKESPDLLLAWNQDEFDYPYLYNRYPDFAKKISPVGLENYKGDNVPSPALISPIDLMALDHKFTGGKRVSYALNNVSVEEFDDEEDWGDTDWVGDPDHVKEKNINDVKRMVRLVEKNQYIEIFDSIRIFSKCIWADLPSEKDGFEWQSNNSKPWDQVFLRLAKEGNLILPSKPKYTDEELHNYEHDVRYKRDGAYRETFKRGIFVDEKTD